MIINSLNKVPKKNFVYFKSQPLEIINELNAEASKDSIVIESKNESSNFKLNLAKILKNMNNTIKESNELKKNENELQSYSIGKFK